MTTRSLILGCTVGAIAQAIVLALAAAQGMKIPGESTSQSNVVKPAPLDFTPDLLRVLKLPSGFTIEKFAEGLRTPRVVVVSPEGALYISSRDEGTITLMPESGGKADPNHVVLQKSNVHGLAFATMNSSTSQFEKFSQRLSIQTVRLERSGT